MAAGSYAVKLDSKVQGKSEGPWADGVQSQLSTLQDECDGIRDSFKSFDQTEYGEGLIPSHYREQYVGMCAECMSGLSYAIHVPLMISDQIATTANNIFPWGYNMIACNIMGNCGPYETEKPNESEEIESASTE